ncbi:MAG: MaoC family dehydratase [Betaproteobacteria bacterium]|nr:MaoC family dehydratase [Betaproteobacteria bacterium]
MVFERYYEDTKVGDECVTPSVTVTDAMIRSYADLSGDHSRIHLDEAFARTTQFGRRIGHGLLGLALTDGLKTQADYAFQPGMSLGWTWDFAGPICIGDALHVRFRVGSRRTTSKPGWGIVVLPSELINQDGKVVQRGEHRLMIPRRPEA